MKIFSLCIFWVACGLSIGCSGDSPYVEEQNAMDRWTVQTYQRQQVENGIIAQQTLYPYHFVADAALLNDLGDRDLTVIAKHYREHPGTLNVRRDGVSDELYDSRLQTVRDTLAEHGVDPKRIEINDGTTGGDGTTALRVLVIHEAAQKRLLEQPDQYRRATDSTGVTR